MRVCHITASYYPLNPAPYEYTRKLVKLGTEVDVIAFGRPEEALNEVIDGVRVSRIPLRLSPRFSWQNSYKFLMAVMKMLNTQCYDLIHVYAFRGCGLLPLLGRRLARRWVLDIRTGSVSASFLRSWLADRMTTLENRAFDACIAIDELVGQRVLGPNRSFEVVPLGVDLAKFKPAYNHTLRRQLGIDDQQLAVVFTSKLESVRQPERILQGFAQAIRERPELVLLVVGDGTKMDSLQLLVEELGINDKVRLIGYIPYARVQEYVTTADIGLAYVPVTPQYMVQPPLKTVEYLACGLPTLATNTQGNRLFIRNMDNGLLIDDSQKAIADGLLCLARDASLREQLASKARASVEAYDWLNIVKGQLLPAYARIIDGDQR